MRTNEPAVALTFDDGPHPETTPRFLEVLEAHGARGTFFVVGSRAHKHPELIDRMVKAGHAVGNHTYEHASVPRLSRSELTRQLEATADAIAPHTTRLFRPPFGHQNPRSRMRVGRLGYEVVGWNGDCRDWDCQEPERLIGMLEAAVKPGAIVLLHDALFYAKSPEFADRAPLLQALDTVLSRLSEQYRFVTVPDLMELGQPTRRAWRNGATNMYLDSLYRVSYPSTPAERQYPELHDLPVQEVQPQA